MFANGPNSVKCPDLSVCGHGCQHDASSVSQSLSEMDFERGLWGAAVEDDLNRVKHLLDKGTPASIRDSSGFN